MTGTTDRETRWSRPAAIVGLIVGLLVVVAGGSLFGMSRPVAQPFPYNHRVHTQKASCVLCHRGVESEARAGLPDLVICAGCHAQPPGETADRSDIRAMWAKALAGESVPAWNRLYRLPEHVYFSHRRHARIAGIECATCHGAMADQTTPPTRPLQTLMMRQCLACHEQNHVTRDCTACHR